MTELTLFFGVDQTFEKVIHELEKVFCMDLAIEQTEKGPRCQFYCLDVEFYFEEYADEDDDGAIEYSKFNYCLRFIKLNRGGYSDEYNDMYTSIAKHYTKKIANALKVNCFLIIDCQDILMKADGQ